jgi:hypothetical protein
MSNPLWNKSTANSRDASGKKIGHYGRGQIETPKTAMNVGAATDKGNAPTSTNRASGGESFKISKGKVTGTVQGQGAVMTNKKQKYTWI